MTLLYKGWRIKNHYYGGFVLQKRIGHQWKEAQYFSSLPRAQAALFDEKVHQATADLVIDMLAKASHEIEISNLSILVGSIRDEIIGVSHG